MRCKNCNKKITRGSKSGLCKSCLFSGEGNPFYKNGRPKCIDCGKELNAYNAKRCRECYLKLVCKYCIDCGKRIKFSSTRCNSCRMKKYIEDNPKFQKKENHYNWQNGKSFEKYGLEFDSSLKEQVRFRDGYKCKLCGCSQLENGRQLDVHHINYNKKNNKLDNLIALCSICHGKTNYNRKYWEKYFQGVLCK